MVECPSIRDLVATAMPLPDRLSGLAAPAGEIASDQVDKRLEHWRRAVSVGVSEDLLPIRLANSGLDEESCRGSLGDVRLSPEQEIPSWAKLLERIHAFDPGYSQPVEEAPPGLLDPEQAIPFQEIFVPWVARASREARALSLSSDGETLIEARAWGDLGRPLLQALAHQAELALSTDFHTYRALRRPSYLFAEAEPRPGSPTDELYRDFVKQMRDGGMRTFLAAYPVLGRLLGTLLEQWIHNTLEFQHRLFDDMPKLREVFGTGEDLGSVNTISCGLSDRHHAGKAVMILAFSSGLKVVYKPKDLRMDVAWYGFLRWLIARGLKDRLRVLRLVTGDGYGWTEYVKHESCEHEHEIQAYYRRAGALLCLVDVLGGNDCHHENLIAAGGDPVLVDTETLMHPGRQPGGDGQELSAFQVAESSMRQSVLRTGLLPSWTRGENGKSYDVSGLGAEGRQVTGHEFPDWKHINTDQMALVERVGERFLSTNTPSLGGRSITVENYADEVVQGLKQTYRLLVEHREALLAADGPTRDFRSRPVRFLARATKSYRSMLSRLRHPEWLENGADRSLEMEHLLTGLLQEDSDSPAESWRLYALECKALESLDIPFFYGLTDRRCLYESGQEVIPDLFESTAYERVMERLANLNEQDLRLQVAYCRAALQIRYVGKHSEPRLGSTPKPAELSKALPIEDELVAAATAIGDDVIRRAIHGQDGSVSWITVRFDAETGRQGLGPMGPSLYDGATGVATFLAGLAAVTREQQYAETALAALQPLCRSIERGGFSRFLSYGGTCGAGGMIYGLKRCADMLGEAALLDAAQALAQTITAEKIEQDHLFDVIGGAAGVILGLLALDDGQEGAALDTARDCGLHLVRSRKSGPATAGCRVWFHPRASQPLTGFAHGAAGIAYALSRLFSVAGEDAFEQAAKEGVAYETAVFDQQERNWPDFRKKDGRSSAESRFMTAWCAGATGIGLARLGSPEIHDAQASGDIERALAATLRVKASASDHVCCGLMGRASFLFEAGKRLNRPELRAEALKKAGELVVRARAQGAFALWAATSDAVFCPSFFQGTSGIGYELLRLSEREQLPSVLLWE